MAIIDGCTCPQGSWRRRRGRPSVRVVRLPVLALLAVVACTADGDAQAPPGSPPAPPAGESVGLPGAAGEEGKATGEITGTLAGDPSLDGGCLWLETPDRPEGRTTVLWPGGSRAAFDPPRLLGPDGEVVARDGDRLRLGGGFVTRPDRCVVGAHVWAAGSVTVTD